MKRARPYVPLSCVKPQTDKDGRLIPFEENDLHDLIQAEYPFRILVTQVQGEYAFSLDKNTDDCLKIGRSVMSHVRFDNVHVSSDHCCFILKPNGLYVTDLDSTNGTFVNGKRIMPGKHSFVVDKDIISLSNKIDLQVSYDLSVYTEDECEQK